MYSRFRPAWLLCAVLLSWMVSNTGAGVSSFVAGSESCPEQLRFPAVVIEELIVDWSPGPLALEDASLFDLPKTETGRMTVVFHDLDARYEFPYYLVIATPYSELARKEDIPAVQSVLDRKPGANGLIAHDLNLEPGYEYGVEVYALSWGQGVRLSAPPEVEYATTLLSPLFFGVYQANVVFGCDQPGSPDQECEITPHTPNLAVLTDLPLQGNLPNSHVLAMASEPTGSPDARTIYFLDPSTFGPGDYVRSDRSEQETHVELTVRTVPGADQGAGRIVYRHRIQLAAETNWIVSEHYYCRGVLPGLGGDSPSPADLCFGPLVPESVEGEVQSNPERFRTAYAISVGVPDGTYDFELVTQMMEKDEDTGDVTYKAVSAPAILRAQMGRPNIFSYTPEEYIGLLNDIEAEFRSDDDDLKLNYWTKVLFPDFEQREALLHALDDLSVKLNSQLE